MTQPLIIDLHLDLAWDALFWNRDLTQTAEQVRRQEDSEIPQVAEGFTTGTCTVTFPEMRRGNAGIMLSTIMSRIEPRYRRNRRDGMRTQEQAMAVGRGHLAYYQAMVRRGEISPVLSLDDLEEAVRVWGKSPNESTPIYHVLSMESADPIIDADDVGFWWDAGLRVVGPAHFGHNTYIHGTFTRGGLKPEAKPLYAAMRDAGMILDITHMSDQAVWESFDIWVKSHFQLKRAQALWVVSARHRELFDAKFRLDCVAEHRQIAVASDAAQSRFNVEQCCSHPAVPLR